MAMDELRSLQPNSGPIQRPEPSGDGVRPQDSGSRAPEGQPFDVVLREHLLQQAPPAPQGVRFSTHAQQRLQQRDITLGDEDVAKINSAVDRAQEKGAKESATLMVNYLYDLKRLDKHRTMLMKGNVPASSAVQALLD